MDVRVFFKKKRREGEEGGREKKQQRDTVVELAPRIYVNRSPVMILWGAVCAERCFHLKWEEALSVASAAASAIARRKAASLDLADISGESSAKNNDVSLVFLGLLGVEVSTLRDPITDEVRTIDRGVHVDPLRVSALLESRFGTQLVPLKAEMRRIAAIFDPQSLKSRDGQLVYDLYVKFRPDVPRGRAGWGAKGSLEIEKLRTLVNFAAS